MSSRVLILIPLALFALLAVGLAVGLVQARSQLAVQNDQIARLSSDLSDSQNAGVALRDDVRRLIEERQSLLQSQEALRGELDASQVEQDELRADRSRLQSERDRLQMDLGSLQSELARLRAEIETLQTEQVSLQTQLAAARSGPVPPSASASPPASAPVPAPAPQPQPDPTRSAALAEVLRLDDEIESEFNVFLGQLEGIMASFNRGNFIAAQAGYTRASESADRLQALFQARNEAARPLR